MVIDCSELARADTLSTPTENVSTKNITQTYPSFLLLHKVLVL